MIAADGVFPPGKIMYQYPNIDGTDIWSQGIVQNDQYPNILDTDNQ